MKPLKAVYNFIVGDMIILVGIVLVFLLLLLINNVASLAAIRPYSGLILVVVILAVLGITLNRELRSKKRV
ncbi:hypothetical protein KDA_71460 [Dictyobacter alpinus]|uniref:Uncharacterized protein n=1 Tax=Dictyobacter alpinus TaxID=2014873 RepID=A0A402BJY3_9CHLR|nr:hypothetical protein [Dictyobacter alpinus]GCE31662.1 hypothetical protein KDA_71460 [Dictyobacter alpinus]